MLVVITVANIIFLDGIVVVVNVAIVVVFWNCCVF